jgi:hypothetical protein
VAWVLSSVNPTRFFRGGAFRLSVIVSTACVISGVLLFAAIYGQTKVFETRRISAFVLMQASTVSRGSIDQIRWMVRSQTDREHVNDGYDLIFAALFAPDGHLVTGNLTHREHAKLWGLFRLG